jgi:hypothetical protein
MHLLRTLDQSHIAKILLSHVLRFLVFVNGGHCLLVLIIVCNCQTLYILYILYVHAFYMLN